MTQSKIEWTECTWNFVTGCDKVSPGCTHCYAESFSRRLCAMGQPKYMNGFHLTVHEEVLEVPKKWRKPRLIFVNSMSDLFHAKIPLKIIRKAFDVMQQAHWHQFQVLTKRSQRLLELNTRLRWPQNVWMGVTVENADYVERIDHLRQTEACVKFLSLEPLLSPMPSLDLDGIDWVIVGGESGPKSRPMRPEWVEDIKDQCVASDVPFFFKQWGGRNKKKTGRLLNGITWDQMPDVALSANRHPAQLA